MSDRALWVGLARRSRTACVALPCVVALSVSAAPSPPRSPLVEPSSDEHHVGKFIFVELAKPDLAAAKAFHGGLFGWTLLIGAVS